VEQEFIDLNATYFDALAQTLDFASPAAAPAINRWVSENTNGKIQEIVDNPIDPSTVLFLINALYFKGTWVFQFEKQSTQAADFYLASGGTALCSLMRQEADLPYMENELFQAVDLAYGNGQYSMVVLLPKPGTDVDSVVAAVDESGWGACLGSLGETTVTLYLPRFKLEYEVELKSALTAMGMGIAFAPGQADFSGINTDLGRELYISKVKHKTFVDVNEEGTEAAAVTSVEIGLTSVGPAGVCVRVDRPFVFAIREKHSQTILFIGKIVNPLAGN
jgi:serpin B